MSNSPNALGSSVATSCVVHSDESAYHATPASSSTPSPKQYAPSDPARHAYSHSSSVASLYTRPVLLDSHTQNCSAAWCVIEAAALFVLLVLLVGSATTLLWRSRKGGRLRSLRRAGIAFAAVLAAYWLVVPVAIAILATHRPRADVATADLGRPYEELTIRTSDGLDLAAWYVPSQNGAAVISYPTRQGELPQARMLVRHGYGLLLLDARGYDGSEGDPNLFGWAGAGDIDAAVAWLQRRPDVTGGRIGGIGFSVGGEMMLHAAASNIGLRAVVSEGAGVRSVREDLIRGPRGWLALPEAAVQTTAVAILSGTRPPPSLTDLVPRISPRPLLLIYAGRGGGGEELNADYYRAARAPKGVWKIAEARHVGGFQTRPRAYEERVTRFFDRALGTRRQD